jgi:ABC-type phosphate/phosphonate transport system permease subunit
MLTSEYLYDFMSAALPGVLLGVFVAIAIAFLSVRHARKESDDRQAQS